MAVEVPRGDGHQDRAQHWVRSQRGDDQQSVQPLGKVSKKRIYSGLCPKHRTPPTHRARLTEWLFSLKSLGLWTPTYP